MREIVVLFLLEITALFFSLNICQVHVDTCKKKKLSVTVLTLVLFILTEY